MKILHVVENLNRGGLERVVLNLVEYQLSIGDVCKIVCVYEEGILVDEARSFGIEVVALHKKNGFDIRLISDFRTVINKFKPDVVHSHNPIPNYYSALALLGKKTPLINTRHGMGVDPYSWKRETLYRLSLFRTQKCIAVCDAAMNSFKERNIFPSTKSLVITNGIKTEKFYSSSENQLSFRSQFKIETSAIVLGTVGRLNHAKDYMTMLNAYNNVTKKVDNVYLVIIGGGELMPELEQFVIEHGLKGKVLLLGDQDDVPYYLSVFDVFVMSSKTEGYSMALLEAGAAGLPYVVTDVGGNCEIVQDAVTGYLTEAGKPEDLAAKIVELIDEDNIEKFGMASKEWAELNGSVASMGDAYRLCYEAVSIS